MVTFAAALWVESAAMAALAGGHHPVVAVHAGPASCGCEVTINSPRQRPNDDLGSGPSRCKGRFLRSADLEFGLVPHQVVRQVWPNHLGDSEGLRRDAGGEYTTALAVPGPKKRLRPVSLECARTPRGTQRDWAPDEVAGSGSEQLVGPTCHARTLKETESSAGMPTHP